MRKTKFTISVRCMALMLLTLIMLATMAFGQGQTNTAVMLRGGTLLPTNAASVISNALSLGPFATNTSMGIGDVTGLQGALDSKLATNGILPSYTNITGLQPWATNTNTPVFVSTNGTVQNSGAITFPMLRTSEESVMLGNGASSSGGGAAMGNDAYAEYGGAAVGDSTYVDSGGAAVGSSASSDSGGAVGYNAEAYSGGGAVGSYANAIAGGGAVGDGALVDSGGGAVGNSASSDSGGAVGHNAEAYSGGGAVGNSAYSDSGGAAVGNSAFAGDGGGGAVGSGASSASGGGAVGEGAFADIGGAVGNGANANSGGGAVGYHAFADGGGAVGFGADSYDNASYAGNGFAGGLNAKAKGPNRVQLGTGTNSTDGTMQFLSYTLVAADGKIPVERLPLSSWTTNANTPIFATSTNVATNAPTNVTVPVGWMPVVISGTNYFMPIYQ